MAVDADAAELTEPAADGKTVAAERQSADHRHRCGGGAGRAVAVGIVMVVALASVAGWLGYRSYQARQAQQVRSLYLQIARQGALNLTTIRYDTAEADVQRILDCSAGKFHDDFRERSGPFIAVVKRAQSRSQGAITEVGLESLDGDRARVLVAVTVKTAVVGAEQEPPHAWRMRIGVVKSGDEVKVDDVEFVP